MKVFWLIVIPLIWISLVSLGVIVLIRARRLSRKAKEKFIYWKHGPWGSHVIKDFKTTVRKADAKRREELIKSQAKYWECHIRANNHYVVSCVFILAALIMAGEMIVLIPVLFK